MSTHVHDFPTELAPLDETGRTLLFGRARTANSFGPEPVSDEQLLEIVELAKFPPTAANTNPLRYVFIRSEAARDRLLPLMSEGNRKKTASAPATAVLAVDTEFHEHVPMLLPHKPELRDSLHADAAGRDRMGRFNATLQAAYFLLAIRAAGLAAGPMAGFDGEGIDSEFLAGTTWRSILVVNFGTPGENPWFERLPRLDYDAMVRHV